MKTKPHLASVRPVNKPVPTVKDSVPSIERMQLGLKQTLDSTGVCEVVQIGSRKEDLRVLFRVKNEGAWLRILSDILADVAELDWYFFAGKKYMLGESGTLVAAWVIFIDTAPGGSISSAVESFRSIVLSILDKLQGAGVPEANPSAPTITGPAPWKLGKFAKRIRPVPVGGEQ